MPSERLAHNFNIVIARYYSDNLSSEVKKGQKEKAEQEHFPGGRPPLGYRLDENKNIVIDGEHAPLTKNLFEWYATGEHFNQRSNQKDSCRRINIPKKREFD